MGAVCPAKAEPLSLTPYLQDFLSVVRENWKIIEVGENKYYQDGVFLLEKGNHVVIYDAENVRIKNIGILKYRIHSENYIRTYYFDFGDINNIWEANLWNSI